MIEIEARDGVRLGLLVEALTVALDLGASEDTVITGAVDQDGRIVAVRIEDGWGRSMTESNKLDKLHRALSHSGQAEACPEASCRRVRLERDSGVQVGREDKQHPAGGERA